MKNLNNPKYAPCFVLEGLLGDTEKRILFGESKLIQFKFSGNGSPSLGI